MFFLIIELLDWNAVRWVSSSDKSQTRVFNYFFIFGECWPKRKGMFPAAFELCDASPCKKMETCFRPCEQETRV